MKKSEIIKLSEDLKAIAFNPNKKTVVRIDVVEVPNTTRDVKNSRGKTKKILPGVLKTLAPVLDKSGRIATGATPDEYESVMKHDPFASEESYADFYRNSYIKIGAAGEELDLSVPAQFLKWKYLQFHPEVCVDINKLNTSHHTYIMIDKEKEATEKLTIMDYKVEAFTLVGEMTEESVKDFLILYGRNSDGVSNKEAKSLLLEYIESDPKKFITLYKDNTREYKINFKKMLKAKILERRGGVFFFGDDISLGATPEQAVENLKSPANQELYINLLQLLEDI